MQKAPGDGVAMVVAGQHAGLPGVAILQTTSLHGLRRARLVEPLHVDVLSAYRIGYAIYALSQWLFRLAKSQLPRALNTRDRAPLRT